MTSCGGLFGVLLPRGMANTIYFPVGQVTEPKVTRSGVCACGAVSYRERYQVGKGWAWVCYACAPEPVKLERRHAAGTKAPMGYVPRSFERAAEHADVVNRGLKSGDLVARDLGGNVKEGFVYGGRRGVT